jgi:nicotinamidase/pyrazinamidase
MIRYSEHTALIVVDCQNDFADAKGSLYVRGGEDVVASVNAEIVRALASGSGVFYTQDWHPATTPHFQKDGGIWPVHCVADTWGAEFHPRLIVAGPTIRKGTNGEDGYSGFKMRDPVTGQTTATELGNMVSEYRHVVVTGLALDYCVKATALDAAQMELDTLVLLQATAAVNLSPDDGAKAVEELVDAMVQVE